MTRYTDELLGTMIRSWSEAWHRRQQDLQAQLDIETVREWIDDERRAWVLVRRFARDHEHWQTRLDLIEAMRAWEARYAMTPLNSRMPRWGADSAQVGERTDDVPVVTGVEASRRRLARLAAALHEGSPAERFLIEGLNRATEQILSPDARTPNLQVIATLCITRESDWAAVDEWWQTGDPNASLEAALEPAGRPPGPLRACGLLARSLVSRWARARTQAPFGHTP